MRKRLSIKPEYFRMFIIPAILVVVIVNLFQIISDKEMSLFLKIGLSLIFSIVFTFTFYFIKIFIKKNPILEFDTTSMYFNNEVIPFKKIISVKQTTNHFNSRYQFQLVYFDKEEKVIKFFPRVFYLNFKEFTSNVMIQNPKAEIQKTLKRPFIIDKNTN